MAEWCPHSKELRQHLETLAKEDSHVVIVLIDVDEAEVVTVLMFNGDDVCKTFIIRK